MGAVREYWALSLSVFSVTVLAALVYLIAATPQYTAYIVVAPSDNILAMNSYSLFGGAGAGMSALGGALGLKGSLNPDYSNFLKLMTSERTAAWLATHDRALQQVYDDYWDPSTNSWRKPNAITGSIKSAVRTLFHRQRPSHPTVSDLSEFLQKNVQIAPVEDTQLRKITFNFERPEYAQQFLLELFRAADQISKADQAKISGSYIEYLETQLKHVAYNDQRETIINLISTEMKRLTLARASVPMDAKIYFGPFVSETPTSPNLAVVLLLGIVLGAALAFLTAIFAQRNGLPYFVRIPVPRYPVQDPMHDAP